MITFLFFKEQLKKKTKAEKQIKYLKLSIKENFYQIIVIIWNQPYLKIKKFLISFFVS